MKTSDYIVRSLYRRGVRSVFELSGGMITHLLNSFYEFNKIRVVSVHHEQTAAFAADATGRLTGVPGVAMATSGPGAINLLNGIGSCYFDSSPGVFLTGQVNLHELRANRPIRQLGFQETDIVSMAKPITKAAWQLSDAADLPKMLDDAFRLAVEGRPGPVLIDIPMNLQNEAILADPDMEVLQPHLSHQLPDPSIWPILNSLLMNASRPLILAGAGVRAGRAWELFTELIKMLGLPVVHSLMATDVVSALNPLRVGMIGSYGNRWANHALALSDLLIVLGSRLDIRQTGNDTNFFRGDRVIVHVDCEAGEINNRVGGCIPVVADIALFLAEANKRLAGAASGARNEWLEEIGQLRRQYSDEKELAGCAGINPNHFMHRLAAASSKAAAYLVDVGQHQMWAAQSLDLLHGQRFLTSGGMGTMGFALPAAIGASITLSPMPVVAIAGDGAFQCNLQELQTVVRNQLPVKIVVMNNHCHGMVRQFQQSYFRSQFQSTFWGYDCPDFTRVADAYGLAATRIDTTEQIEQGLDALWECPDKPFLLEVDIDTFTNVYPKIAFGKPLTEMEPDVAPTMMENT